MSILQLAGSRIEYLDVGKGEPVVLLHSSGSSHAQWRALVERLGERYRVLAPDFYGYGGSSQWPGGRPFHLECEAEIVLALLARVNERAHLVGHSYGGAVALRVAGLRGDLLRSLTLFEPVAFHLLKGTDAAALAEISEVADTVRRAIACGDYVAGFGRFFDYWNSPGASTQIPADKRYVMAARLAKIGLEFHAALSEPTRPDDFRFMTVPTLLVSGSKSPLPTRRICELLMPVLPRAQLKTIDGAGHMAPLTHGAQVSALVTAHIEANSARQITHPVNYKQTIRDARAPAHRSAAMV